MDVILLLCVVFACGLLMGWATAFLVGMRALGRVERRYGEIYAQQAAAHQGQLRKQRSAFCEGLILAEYGAIEEAIEMLGEAGIYHQERRR